MDSVGYALLTCRCALAALSQGAGARSPHLHGRCRFVLEDNGMLGLNEVDAAAACTQAGDCPLRGGGAPASPSGLPLPRRRLHSGLVDGMDGGNPANGQRGLRCRHPGSRGCDSSHLRRRLALRQREGLPGNEAPFFEYWENVPPRHGHAPAARPAPKARAVHPAPEPAHRPAPTRPGR